MIFAVMAVNEQHQAPMVAALCSVHVDAKAERLGGNKLVAGLVSEPAQQHIRYVDFAVTGKDTEPRSLQGQ